MARKPRRKGGTLKDGERRQLARASRHAAGPPPPGPADWPRLLCDGGSRGNPGPAAAAAVLLAPCGAVLAPRAVEIGRAGAAEAEYRAILLGLELADEHGTDPLEIRSDSQIAIAALTGEAPHDDGLAALVQAIHAATEGFSAVRWRWHRRAANAAADELVRHLLWPS